MKSAIMRIEAWGVMEYKGGDCMTEKEMMKISVEEFSRIQDWMELAEKDSAVYQSLKKRYIDLKVILTSSGINLTEIDRIKE